MEGNQVTLSHNVCEIFHLEPTHHQHKYEITSFTIFDIFRNTSLSYQYDRDNCVKKGWSHSTMNDSESSKIELQ